MQKPTNCGRYWAKPHKSSRDKTIIDTWLDSERLIRLRVITLVTIKKLVALEIAGETM